MFKVSVIVPVYNAENFLRKAIASVVNLNDVGEIIMIEDASPDNALEVAKELEKEFEKVKLYQHPNKGNHGAGASRNLGIKKANYPYVSFLDADDYYLPNRFQRDKEIFESQNDAEGVYNCVGTYFYSDKARVEFFDQGLGYQETLTLNAVPSPKDLFQVLFHQHPSIKGEFHTNGITLKKTVFHKVGYFNTALKLQQDIHLWRRIAGFCYLYAGNIDAPTAMRGIHSENRMTRSEDHDQYRDLWWRSLKQEFRSKNLEKSKYALFEQCYINYLTGHSNKFIAIKAFLRQCVKFPKSISKAYGDFDFNVWKVFGKNWLTLHFVSIKNKLLA